MTSELFDFDTPPGDFEAPVTIPTPGGGGQTITVQYHYLDREAYGAAWKECKDKPEAEFLGRLVKGWSGTKAAYSPEALGRLCRNFPRAGKAILDKFLFEVMGVPEKN